MKPLEQYKNMNMNIENKDKATKAMGDVASSIKDALLEQLGVTMLCIQEINCLDSVTTKEELEKEVSNLEHWDSLDLRYIYKEVYGVDTLEEAIEVEVAQEEAKQAYYKSQGRSNPSPYKSLSINKL